MISAHDFSFWLERAPALVKEGIGLLDVGSDVVLGKRPGMVEFLDSSRYSVYLGHLTEDLLSDSEEVKDLLRKATDARREGLALLASTPLNLPLIYGSEEDDSQPNKLDVAGLVARSELAYLLERNCTTGATSAIRGALFLTPIEERMADALARAEIEVRSQVSVGRRRVDFLFEDSAEGVRLAIECDGASFHDPDDDAIRDRELDELGVDTIRFPGSAIIRDSALCASKVRERITNLRDHPEPDDAPNEAQGMTLSSAQLRAVTHRAGPARVAAPAGSGKTRVVEQRVRALVAGGIEASRICAISFTNAAVDEMRDRLEEGGFDCHFSTVHKLAKGIAEARFRDKTLIQNISPDNSRKIPSRWTILRDILTPEELYMNRPKDFWVEAVTYFRQSFEIPDFEDWDEKNRPSRVRFDEICSSFEAHLQTHRLTDFEGYVHDALRALASDANFRAEWAGKFDYWIVDEYQDLPQAKLWLLRLLAAPARNLFVVGDDDQVIFEFAGASGTAFAAFTDHFPDAEEYLLDRNYRSPHDLVIRSGWMIQRNKARVEKATRACQPLDDVDRVTIGREEAYDVAGIRFIREKLDAGCAPEDIAILFRLSDMALPLELLLARDGVPFRPCARPSFFESKPVKTLMSWLRLVDRRLVPNRDDIDRTLRWPPRYISNQQIADLLQALTVLDDIDSVTETAIRYSAENFNDVGHKGVSHWADVIRRTPDSLPPTEALERLGLREVAKNDRAPVGHTSPVVLYDIFFRISSQFTAARDLLAWVSANRFDTDYEPDSEEGLKQDRGLVTLATVHEAKGREWEHVAVLGPSDGMPDHRAETEERQEEERRIAYVAVTRAKKSVFFNCSLKYAAELESRVDGLSWEAYRTEGGGLPPGIAAVKKRGVWVIKPDQPFVEGETRCACGVRLLVLGETPSSCPTCGSGQSDPIT